MKAIVISFLLLFPFLSSSQSRLSPKFFLPNARMENRTMDFSVAVSDPHLFTSIYKDSISILYYYAQSKTFIVRTRHSIVANKLSQDTNVLFVDIVAKAVPEAGTDYFNRAFNKINMIRTSFPLSFGAGQNILIKEQLFDTTNIDLVKRSFNTPVAANIVSQHATTIATIIAGAGNSSDKGEGVAKASMFGSSDFKNLLPDDDAILSSDQIHLENHSYGVDVENYYGNEAAAYDQQVYNNPTLLHIFSAGNSGEATPTTGTYSGLDFANLSGNFKQAKNILTITAVDTSFTVNKRNSKGPAYDGRVKPELTAFGQDGTSDAAAVASGICILLQEKYLELFHKFPTVAELKSILIASADDIETKGIDFTSGYGSINANKAMTLLQKGNLITTVVNSNEQITVPISVASGIHKLTVAISWIDPPAQQNSSTALVNDINATLSNGLQVYYPWVLSSIPNTDSLQAIAKQKPDHLNTVEYFTINEPTAGSYALTLDAPSMTTSQEVSIAYWLDEESVFNWNYPVHSDVLQANEKTALVWSAQHQSTGTLSLQIHGGSWKVLQENLDLSSYFHWNIPDTLTWARLKMEINNTEYLSDSFLISPKPTLVVAFNCNNQFALTWNPIRGASAYEVYTLDDQYLKSVTSVNDTTLVLTKTSDYYFAIAPKLKESTGLKAQTLNYTNQGALCYINLFDAERFENDRVTLQLKLSSTLNIDHITIYKIVNQDTVNILSSERDIALDNNWYDSSLVSGEMRYQAMVVLSNGTHLMSEIRSVYIEQKNKVILFPNPVTDNVLNILSEGEGFHITILNLLGDRILTYTINSVLDQISVSNLNQGIYILELYRQGKRLDSKKFIKY